MIEWNSFVPDRNFEKRSSFLIGALFTILDDARAVLMGRGHAPPPERLRIPIIWPDRLRFPQ